MCPPESADKCNCSIYDDEQDKAKNSNNVFESIFNRVSIISSGGIGGFESIDILSQYIQSENLKIFGDGLGISNLKFSPRYDELTKQINEMKSYIRTRAKLYHLIICMEICIYRVELLL